MKQRITDRYYKINLKIAGHTNKTMLVHRLVALNFIPNPLNKIHVNHINGIKTDNRVVNLEWNTAKENHTHAVKNGFIKDISGENNIKARFKEVDVREIRRLYVNDKLTIKEISLKYNAPYSTIFNILKQTWKKTI